LRVSTDRSANSTGKGSQLYRILKLFLSPLLHLQYRVSAEGVESFPPEGPVIVASNHLSFMDSVFMPLCAPRRIVFLSKAEYFDSPKTAWLFRALGMIPVRREARKIAEAALEAALRVLRAGEILGLYPEGTRSPDGRLYRGRTGVARLALRSQAPVVPVGITGTREVMPKAAKLPKPWGSVTVRFGNPLSFDRHVGQPEDRSLLREITDEVMNAIASLSGQTYVDRYASREATELIAEEFRIPTEELLG
jgi:1-acyl-sn-glycerol-3-phosphate acyltransferase